MLFYDKQFEFHSKNSIIDASAEETENLKDETFRKIRFQDLNKAFDTMDQHILLKSQLLAEYKVVLSNGLKPIRVGLSRRPKKQILHPRGDRLQHGSKL